MMAKKTRTLIIEKDKNNTHLAIFYPKPHKLLTIDWCKEGFVRNRWIKSMGERNTTVVDSIWTPIHAAFVLIIGVTSSFISVPFMRLEISKSFYFVPVAMLLNTKEFGTSVKAFCSHNIAGCSCIIVNIDMKQKQIKIWIKMA